MNQTKLYTTSICIDNMDLERHESEVDENYPVYESEDDIEMFGGAGYATFNEDGYNNVYAESLVSQQDADRLVLELCEELAGKFARAAKKVEGEV